MCRRSVHGGIVIACDEFRRVDAAFSNVGTHSIDGVEKLHHQLFLYHLANTSSVCTPVLLWMPIDSL